jgi:hypothetical protein
MGWVGIAALKLKPEFVSVVQLKRASNRIGTRLPEP